MPRPEQPLTGEDALTAFAGELRALRQTAGSPPYRRLAREAHYSSTTLADAAGGQRLPSLAVTLAYARACGGDPEAWDARWHEVADALAEQRRRAASADEPDAQCPYVGLSAFEPGDAARFFGRDRLTGELVSRVRSQRFVALFGASGSGKSSLLRAGLLPRLSADLDDKNGEWPVLLFTPGPHPLDQCAAQVAAWAGGSAADLHRQLREDPRALHLTVLQALADRPSGTDLLIVVDQFEEVFTFCASAAERAEFISILLNAVGRDNSRVRLVIGVRADFYPRCAQHPELVEALRDAQLLIGPMTTDELRQAISRPAAAVGHSVESALLARVVADAAGQANALPLVSHALRETWRHKRGNTLTVTGYEAAGGIHHALARTAEEFYETLTDEQRRLARGILLRLVALGEGTEDTKRRVARDELAAGDADAVLDALARSRLVVLDAGAVELTHEALLHAWPRLRRWIDEDRAELLIRQQLANAAAAWDREGRDPGALYRGERLAAAGAWVGREDEVPLDERTRQFLAASQRHARRGVRLRRGAIAGLAALALAASVIAGVALQQRAQAQTERDDAVAGQVLSEAQQLESTDPSLAAQLALTSYRIDATPAAYTQLLDTENVVLSNVLTGHTDKVYAVAYSPNGRVLASAGADGTVRLWRTGGAAGTGSAHPSLWAAPIATHSGGVYWLAFSPDGRTLAVAGANATVQLWNVADPAHPVAWGPPLTGHSEYVFSVSFSADGAILASASADHTVRLWDVHDPAHPTPVGHPLVSSANIASATFSPRGRTLAVAGHDNTIQLWNLTDPANPVLWSAPLTWNADTVYAVAFSPDGSILASASGDTTVRLWNIGDPRNPVALGVPLTGHTDVVYAVAFSPDGRILASASADQTIRLWDVTDPAHPIELGRPLTGHTGYVYSLAFSPDGHTLASASADETVRVWNIPSTDLVAHTSYVNGVAYSPNGRLLASVSSDETIALWNVADPGRPALAARIPSGDTQPLVSAAFSPDGRVLATSSRDGAVRLWNVQDPAHAAALGGPLTSASGFVTNAAFSPDGRILATAGVDQTVRLWNVADPSHPTPVGGPLTGHTDDVFWVAFSPDGRTLYSAGADDLLVIWDIADPARPVRLSSTKTASAGVEQGAISPDGRVLATAGEDYTVRLWNIADPRHITQIGPALSGNASWVLWVGFANHDTLASTGADGTIRLWDVSVPSAAAQVGQPLTDHTAAMDHAAFSPDGEILATASDDHTVQLTDLDVNQAVAHVCATTRDTLTPALWHQYVPDLPYTPSC